MGNTDRGFVPRRSLGRRTRGPSLRRLLGAHSRQGLRGSPRCPAPDRRAPGRCATRGTVTTLRSPALEPGRTTTARNAATGFGYKPALDGLRALAVVSVMAYHFGAVMGAGRLPRRRHVLRVVGLPHHVAAARRVARYEHRAARCVLGTACPSPAPGAVPRARRDLDLGVGGCSHRPSRRHPRRFAVDALLRRQLALHRVGPVVLRPVQ